ncbi:DNA ligase [bacterium]|nr:DNA ligase [bacterium]MBU1993897.1 DNA ligase [bacterium]
MKLFVLAFLLVFHLDANVLQKANIYKEQNISGWMMSEKLDGIRAFWDGKNLRSRQNKIINAPSWFREKLPPFALDGELWSKRGDFENIQSIVMDEVPHARWDEIKYMIFEVPHAEGDFNTRLNRAKKYKDELKLHHIEVIEQKICAGPIELDVYLQSVLAKGGEGVMIKDGSKSYFEGRSDSILKVKASQDMEAEVIGYKNASGKFTGMMGSLHVKLENGVQFYIGSGFSDAQRKNPPPLGSVVTFKYFGFTKYGKPKFASFIRVRKD